ncbi:MAG: molybdopterin-guanine dinucleotide biosynthesis protein B [Nitrospinae bacterium]|nr:molybdopterin-guanine dinucleotide biosynthesis protein B [Nitrospinota bacterium]
MDKKPALLAFSGPSGSGKTSLIEKLLARLVSGGIRAGAIKRSHHKVDLDREGKDSARFSGVGANPVIIATEDFIGYMERTQEPPKPASLAKYFEGKADIVIIEGYKDEAVRKLVFADPGQTPPEGADGYITVGDPGKFTGADGRPVFHRDDVDGILRWILNTLLPEMRVKE